MYTLILTMILTGGYKQGVSTSIESVEGFGSYEQCLVARSSWLQDHGEVSFSSGLTTLAINFSAVCVKTGD